MERRRSFCRIRPCIQSRNGAGLRFGGQDVAAEQAARRPRERRCAQIEPRRPANTATLACAAASTFRCPRNAPPKFAPRRAASAATCGDDRPGFWPGRGRSRSCSPSRTCIGPIRRRSTSSRRWPNAARKRRCSSSPRRGPSSARPGGCAHTMQSISLAPLDRAEVRTHGRRDRRAATRYRKRLSRGSASAPAACRCSLRR